MSKKALVTGSCGLIGSETVRHLVKNGFEVTGIDNNLRQYFFGAGAGTDWNRKLLEQESKDKYIHLDIDIRDKEKISELFTKKTFDLIVHTAAQPSHDWAAREPFTDFDVNAGGTLVLLENTRRKCPDAVFVFTSTNKVYGDKPNFLPIIEQETRWEIDPTHEYAGGIDETMGLDNCTHSLFGVSKASADLMVQEYGRYFGLKTACLRGGCLTGPHHSGAELHGFLSYFVKCAIHSKPYTIIGYKGKQVRDNIHCADLVDAIYRIYQAPRTAEVYNIGGGRESNVSILEAIAKTEKILGKTIKTEYKDTPRTGDHIWYISSLDKFKEHYPGWKIRYDIDKILESICAFETDNNK